MDFTEFIKPELLLLIPVCYALGVWFKSIDTLKNWLIPFILMGIGVACSLLYLMAVEFSAIGNLVAAYIFTSFTQGVLVAAAAVLGANIVKQLTTGRAEDDAGTHPE